MVVVRGVALQFGLLVVRVHPGQASCAPSKDVHVVVVGSFAGGCQGFGGLLTAWLRVRWP